eukprot:6204917-Pleurochrysis_carterae.AAC.5
MQFGPTAYRLRSPHRISRDVTLTQNPFYDPGFRQRLEKGRVSKRLIGLERTRLKVIGCAWVDRLDTGVRPTGHRRESRTRGPHACR